MHLTVVDAAVKLVIESYTFISLEILSFQSVFLLLLTFYCTVLNSNKRPRLIKFSRLKCGAYWRAAII